MLLGCLRVIESINADDRPLLWSQIDSAAKNSPGLARAHDSPPICLLEPNGPGPVRTR